MAEKRRFYGGMKPVGRPKHETTQPMAPPPPVPARKKDTRPPQKGTGEESVE